MAAEFTKTEWTKVNTRLSAAESRYGMPEKRSGSTVMASFNIRKCADPSKRSEGALALLAEFISRCDLVAVQEVLENLAMLEELRARASALAGAEYRIIASDVTGGVVGGRGLEERLAFLYRTDRVRPGPVASDISYDRTWVLKTLYTKRADFIEATVAFEDARTEYMDRKLKQADWKLKGEKGERPPGKSEPVFVAPHFVTFIRTPHCVSFEVGEGEPYRFTAVNAHLLYGDKSRQREEREREFEALTRWMIEKAARRNSYNQDYILFGDLNLDFAKSDVRRTEIVEKIKAFNDELADRRAATDVNFPFIDERVREIDDAPAVIRTNARRSETFDQIGIFANDERFPRHDANPDVNDRRDPDAYDYNVFDFVTLFVEALHGEGTGLEDLSSTDRSALFKRFEYDVSDHMPIWVRLPMPG